MYSEIGIRHVVFSVAQNTNIVRLVSTSQWLFEFKIYEDNMSVVYVFPSILPLFKGLLV